VISLAIAFGVLKPDWRFLGQKDYFSLFYSRCALFFLVITLLYTT